MKFLTERQLLHQAASLPLTEIKSEDVESTINHIRSRTTAGEKIGTHCSVTQYTNSSTPRIFRKPASPYINKHRLINLSFSQPSSPKTPSVKTVKTKKVYATPFVNLDLNQGVNNDHFVPPTPMIINNIEMLNCTKHDTDAFEIIPDILEIIDDETGQVHSLDSRLKLLSHVELTDDTVVEYLLDMSHEVQPKQSQPPSIQDCHPERGRVRKKSRYTKLMSEEEREALRHIQKEKSKQKRKQRFKEPPVAGSRRSKRIRQPVRHYTPLK